MFVLMGDAELYLHGVRNLKQKRMILKSCKDHMKNKFDLIVREDRFKDKWQRTALVFVSAADDRDLLVRLFEDALEFISRKYDVDILEENREIICL